MEFISEALNAYAERHTSPENPLLQELHRETYAKVLMPRMLSGHLQGRFLSMISKMVAPDKILEIGTYTGYSALCLAEGLQPGGSLHTIDINDELSGMVRRYIDRSEFKDRIHTYWGHALDIIPVFDFQFDIVFIDADKINYSAYYDLVFDKVKKGGWIIADNVLWSGKILQNETEMDKDTLALHRFNEKIHADPRVETMLAPIRDGLMIIRKS